MSEIKYVICYLAGDHNVGVSSEWVTAHDMEEAMQEVNHIKRDHEFATITIAEIKESYEHDTED
jgi:3,4-dihydroxy-2-butanone 4-phosphate synthase